MKIVKSTNLENLSNDLLNYLETKYNIPLDYNKQIHNQTPVTTSQVSSFGSAVLSAAKADLGVHEDFGHNDGKRIREYFKNYGMSTGQDWCAAAVSTWMKEAGGGPIRGGVGVLNIVSQFKSVGLWVAKNNLTAQAMLPGNIVCWSRNGPNSGKGHIGVINYFDGKNNFTSIEANSGPKSDSVVVNSHSITDSNLLGVGILSTFVANKKASLERLLKEAETEFLIHLK